MIVNTALGFSTPVFDSQRVFRAIMDTMARPASTQNLKIDLTPPDGLPIAAAGCVLTLCDFETSLWVSPHLDNASEIAEYCVFQTGCTRAKTAKEAHFALIDLASEQLRLADFAPGTAEYPDRSTTIIGIVPSLIGGAIRGLAGPGIQTKAQLFVEGLPDDFAAQWAANYSSFPLGVDIIFCAGSCLLALPRSSRIMEGF